MYTKATSSNKNLNLTSMQDVKDGKAGDAFSPGATYKKIK